MKYLSEYMEDRQTALFEKTGSFFAFSKKQFDEQKKKNVKYMSLGSGMICPESTAEELVSGIETIAKESMAQDLAENGRKGVIHRELGNHEYCITHDIVDTSRALSGYGITDEEIQAETRTYLKAYYEWEEKRNSKEVAT